MTAAAMPVLTLWQPWASLIAIGVKRIETRSWSTKYRGPIAIHAAKTTAGIDVLVGDCDGKNEDGWVYGYVGDYQAAYCARTGDTGRRGDAEMVHEDTVDVTALPLGAIVATARLVGCVPMSGDHCARNVLDVVGTPLASTPDLVLRVDDGGVEQISVWDAELPYGDFAVGRWAWLLGGVEALPEPVPFKGGQGLSRRWSP